MYIYPVMSNYLKSVLATGHIHSGDVDQIGKLRIVMVFQELQHWHHSFRADQDFQLISGRKLSFLHILGQTVGHIFSKIRQRTARSGIRLAYGRFIKANKINKYFFLLNRIID